MRLGYLVGLFASGALVVGGCGGPPEGCDHYVTPGDDDQTAIQTALITAADGETVCLGEGTFTLSDPLEVSNRTGFTLRGAGMDETILDFSGQEAGGTGVDMTNMTNVLIEQLAIMDAAGNGLRVSGSNGVVIRRVRAGWTAPASADNGKYAIYPVSSSNVLVEGSEAFGSSDAGFYMGQVTTCVMRNNLAYGNVAAYEVENSVDCEVYGNTAENNTGGILVFELPGLPMRGTGTLVHDNVVRNNNLDNFGDPAAIIGLLPAGTGMFILAANDVEIRDNTIEGHVGVGVAVLSYGTPVALGQGQPSDPGYDPFAEDVWIHDNTMSGNGTMPGRVTPAGAPDALMQLLAIMGASGLELETLEPIVWDGFLDDGATPDVVCIQDNGGAAFRNLDIEGLAAMDGSFSSSTDASPHDCEGTPRPATDLGFASFAIGED